MEQHATRTAPKCATCKYYGRNSMAMYEHHIVWAMYVGYATINELKPLCKSPYAKVDVVTGEEITLAKYMREDDSNCGEKGNWYEQEEPLVTPEPTPELAIEIEPPPQPKRKWWQFGGK